MGRLDYVILTALLGEIAGVLTGYALLQRKTGFPIGRLAWSAAAFTVALALTNAAVLRDEAPDLWLQAVIAGAFAIALAAQTRFWAFARTQFGRSSS